MFSESRQRAGIRAALRTCLDIGFSDIGSGYVSVAFDRTKMRLKRAVSKDGAIGFAPLLVKLTGP